VDPLKLYPSLIVLVVAGIAAVSDLRWFKIYNVLTLPMIVSGLVYHAAFYQTAGLLESLGGAVVGGGALMIIYLAGGMGAGDVKLMAGVGAWLGLPATFYVLVASSLAAGAYAIVILTMYGGFSQVINNLRVIYYQIRAISAHLGHEETAETLVQAGDTRRLIPFGVMIVVGIIAWLIWRP